MQKETKKWMQLALECESCLRFLAPPADDEINNRISPSHCSPETGFPFQLTPNDAGAAEFQQLVNTPQQ